ncbi:MAG: hypothetical protein KBB01_02980 [Candidatus Omnitrophica bacterium]|jgi:processive 1,2-diacylglycerol beta-glucosyltransferase|nr:hypothetical protein [Candidatus Omnitrophota bacterium]
MDETLVVYASFGEGHKRAAYALEESLNASSKDLLDFSHPFIKKIYPFIYRTVTQYYPSFWCFLYSSVKKRPFLPLVNQINKIIFLSFRKYLYKVRPKTIIFTHFFPAVLIDSIIKKELKLKLISVVTDLRAYPLWADDNIDYYFAALDITKDDLIKLGVKESKIAVGFAPIRRGFLKRDCDKYLADRLFLRQNPILIFTSTSKKTLALMRKSLDFILKDFNVIVIYGRDKKLKQYLEQLHSPYVKYFSFYDNIWELITISSIIIGKPGGLTIFEGIFKKKPFIFTHYIPGQEEENMRLMLNCGIARFIKNKDELLEAIYYFYRNRISFNDNYPLTLKNIH